MWLATDFPSMNKEAGQALVDRIYATMGRMIDDNTWLDDIAAMKVRVDDALAAMPKSVSNWNG